jgi:2-C-methyl-D-erythritol 2,4-cyclodiphosphate synthase
MDYRVGFGYDIHRFTGGRPLRIGGIEIPHAQGLLGHSDADVLLHAVCDALLGAAGLGDIGEHFPDTDPTYRGIASSALLTGVYELIRGKGYEVENADCVVIAEVPSLSPFKKAIERSIAGYVGVEPSQVTVKAKTNDGMGEIGRREGIAAYCVVLLHKTV